MELIEYTMEQEEMVPAVTRHKGKRYCNRCSNQQQNHFYQDDRGCYCEVCLTFGKSADYRFIARKRLPPLKKADPALSQPIALSDFQTIASNKCLEAYRNGIDMLIFAVCGAGKSEMVYAVILEAIREGKRVCFATPRKDVVLELKPRFQRDFQNIDIIALYGGSPDRGKDGHLILSTTHQLIHYYRFFDLIILDEVDAFPFYNNKTLMYFVHKAKRPGAPIIYLTATPTKELKQAMRKGQIAYTIIPSRFHRHPIPVPRVQLIHGFPSYLRRGKLHPAIERWLNDKKANNKQVYIFVPRLQLGTKLESILKRQGYDAQFVSSKSPDRKEIVKRFRQGSLSFIITTTILERGVTVPHVDVCIIEADDEIFDERAIVQIVGRAGRAKDDPNADVRLFCETYTKGIKEAIRHILMMNRLNERCREKGNR